MKKVIFAIMLFGALMMSVPVMAQDGPVVITTGGKTGTYIKVGHNLKAMLGQGTVMTSKGSVQNLERLLSGEAQIGLVQMDAFAYHALKHPEVNSELEIMGSLYKECAYLAVNKKGTVRNEDDLQNKKDVTIAVGKLGSGTAVTWDYMIQLEPKYKNANVEFKGGTRALGKLALGNGALDAVMWVTKPVLTGKMAQTVMNHKDLMLVGFNDKDLNDKLKSTGKPVYTFEKIETAKGFFNDKEITTACVEAVIVARADLDEDVLDRIADVLMNYKKSLLNTGR